MRYRLIIALAIIGFAVSLGFVVGNRLPDQALAITLAVSVGVVVGVPVGVVSAMLWLRAYAPRRRPSTSHSGDIPVAASAQTHRTQREFDLVGGADLIMDENDYEPPQ